MTLRDFLEYGASQLGAGPHPDRAKRDAETLLLHLIGKNKAWLMSHANDDFAGCSAIRYASLLERRVKGEPIQYIIGEAEFYGLPFRVTPDVLIPRPETEHLVEKCLALAAQLAPRPRLLDVGSGSGAIAIALAKHLPNATITAADISERALAVACENARRNEVTIRFLQGDLLAPVAGERF
jgi:release factor glutamine methyltransferase